MNPLDLVKLTPLMELTSGRPEVIVGLIDGSVAINHPEFVSANIREIPQELSGQCVQASSAACLHGTFVAGILSGKRNSVAPAICPNCTLLVRSIFTGPDVETQQVPSATPANLAAAIIESINSGALILNMSLALAQLSSQDDQELDEALDYALERGVIVVAASGNQGTLGSTPITRHPWVIPVIACDLEGIPTGYSNLGSSVGRRGLSAPGDRVTSLGTKEKTLTLGGTSVATPFVTGALALLWSLFPTATAAEVKFAVTQSNRLRQNSIIPPLLNAWAAYQFMTKFCFSRIDFMEKTEQIEPLSNTSIVENESSTLVDSHKTLAYQPSTTSFKSFTKKTLIPQNEGECPTCRNASNLNFPPSYIYALGRVEWRFPKQSVEKEFAQVTGRMDTIGQTDREVISSVLSQRQNRYLVRQLCWILTIEGLETYILQPSDPGDFDLLVEAVRPAPSPLDIDIIIGIQGPIASPDTCNGLMLPIVIFNQIYSFDRSTLLQNIPRPETIAEEQFTQTCEELLERIMQMADNAGATDDHRALNYLVVRYPTIYAKLAECYGQNCSLTAVNVRPSALSSSRKIVDVIFVFTNRNTDVSERYFVRVDITEEFPFLVTKMSPYYEC